MSDSRFKYIWRFVTALILLLWGWYPVQAQQEPYHRFQYHRFQWRSFQTEIYHLYYPAGNDSLAALIAGEMPGALKDIRKKIGAGIAGTPNVIVYPSVDQLYESNIGMTEMETFSFPTFVYKNQRMLLAYTGNAEDLRAQVRLSVARCVWESQLREGDEAGSQLKGKELSPYWFREGAIRYFALDWGIADEDRIYRLLCDTLCTYWQAVLEREAVTGGQAFCYFLSQQYHPATVARMFVHLRKGKSLSRALRLVTKRELSTLLAECMLWYRQRLQPGGQDSVVPAALTVLPHKQKKGAVRSVQLSAGDDKVLYEIEGYHKRVIYSYDPGSGQKRKLLTYRLPPYLDEHTTDPYPLWEAGKQGLTVTMPVKGKMTAGFYDGRGKRSERYILKAIDGLQTIQMPAKNRWLLSAYRNGHSDIVEYDPQKDKYHPFTRDHWYDGAFALRAEDNSFYPYWISDRPLPGATGADSLRRWQGIFHKPGSVPAPVVADTLPYAQWSRPVLLKDGRLLARHTGAGTERFMLIGDPEHPSPAAALGRAYEMHYNAVHDQVVTFRTGPDSVYISGRPLQEWLEAQPHHADTNISPWLQDYQVRMAKKQAEDSLLALAAGNNTPSFLDGVLRGSRAKKDSTDDPLRFNPRKTNRYILQLYSAYFSLKVNNDYFINRYQPYENYQGTFKFPEVGGMVQGGVSDLFENHHINIAFRLPAGTDGSDFFIKYYNTSKRTNWGLQYFRKVESLQPDPKRNWVNGQGQPYPNLAKVKTHYYEVFTDRPFTYDFGVSFSTAIRYDRTIFQSTELYSLEFPDLGNIWWISVLSVKKNLLQPTASLLYKGMSGKAGIDIFKAFTGEEAALFGSTVHVAYHQPLYRYITLVVQGQAGYSGGAARLLYNMGGLENNLVPRIDTSVHFAQDAPYAFQTLITPFRGYYQNSLYGDRYALLNGDVYVPLFETLIPLETPLSFVNCFQPGIFADLGGAQESWRIPASPHRWLWSYGLSARTKLAGYLLRFDIGWPGTFSQKPVWYLSLRTP